MNRCHHNDKNQLNLNHCVNISGLLLLTEHSIVHYKIFLFTLEPIPLCLLHLLQTKICRPDSSLNKWWRTTFSVCFNLIDSNTTIKALCRLRQISYPLLISVSFVAFSGLYLAVINHIDSGSITAKLLKNLLLK